MGIVKQTIPLYMPKHVLVIILFVDLLDSATKTLDEHIFEYCAPCLIEFLLFLDEAQSICCRIGGVFVLRSARPGDGVNALFDLLAKDKVDLAGNAVFGGY